MTSNDVQKNEPVYYLLFSQLFKDLRLKVKKQMLNRDIAVPWMRYREIEIILDLIKHIKPKAALEWGAGAGTTFFTQYIPDNSKWLSVEHDKEWALSVIENNTNPDVTIEFKEPNSEPEPGIYTCGTYTEENDGTYKDFKDYIEFPEQYAPFDFIMVDGRARSQCLTKAKDLLSKEGIALLHDANRSYYHDAFDHFEQGALFLDHRDNYGGIWIGKNGEKPLSNFIDIKTYSRLWNAYQNIGRFIQV